MLKAPANTQLELFTATGRSGSDVFAWNGTAFYRLQEGKPSFEALARPGAERGELLVGMVAGRDGLFARTETRSTSSGLYRSDGGGSTWARLPNPDGWWLDAVAPLPNGLLLSSLLSATGPRVACSADVGATWTTTCRPRG